MESYLTPNQIPTLFISALPLRSDEVPLTRIFYPDAIRDDKQVYIF